MKSITSQIAQFWSKDHINYSFRVLIALTGAALTFLYFNELDYVVPIILGVIASVLAETDDNSKGRINALIIMLSCFFIASLSIELLFDTPLLFAIGLFTSCIGFIMIGAIGQRYAAISFASILLAVYTMIGHQISPSFWFQPTFLLIGAAWYSLVSLVWQMIWPYKPVQQSLSNLFTQFADYLEYKSELFIPVSNLTPQPYRIKAAALNNRVVAALEQTKQTIQHRSKQGKTNQLNDRYLKIYFLAQDMHERASSSHYRYQDLANAFNRSDILFRFNLLMKLQSEACRDISNAILLNQTYHHDDKIKTTLLDIKAALDFLQQQEREEWQILLMQLEYLFDNLSAIEQQLANITNNDKLNADTLEETKLSDTLPHNLSSMASAVINDIRLNSSRFRHSVRLAIALTVGYGIVQLFDLEHGYWILLTTLLVCQPNYGATKNKLTQRIAGTIIGLLVGAPLLYLLTNSAAQLTMIVISGLIFITYRTNRYTLATASITILVLFCFIEPIEAFEVMIPRLGDTIIGCALAVISVMYILPDWQYNKLHKVMASAIEGNCRYLDQIIAQYRIGKKNDLKYRIARRDAHHADANLSTTISDMLAEPERYQSHKAESFRFLTLNHALLSYISTLGAHRRQLDCDNTHLLISQAHRQIHFELVFIQQTLLDNADQIAQNELEHNRKLLENQLNQWNKRSQDPSVMVFQQLHLIYMMLEEMRELAATLKSVH
ncbi:YccS family putative transporter [Vibrio sp. SS-MA-C1-2]|uniref:YccS family putative transporter n=1 Tax=Vibrio sp. SS-MA-C1-2 TaxID=2908646 RepID=UPI001F1E73E5|nr:YccS family putative transporter [Vibrio sp. SS-MA-C1-2]UJF18175.1 YccS family putative transporter [Vibrio sp. SS-MA-C1-2]